jgi:hypothetical protein
VATSLFPAFGMQNYRPSFQLLIILYLGLRVNVPFLPVLILGIQFFHSAFTIDGWAHGTFAGVLICVIINLLKDVLHLKSPLVTIIIVQLLQVIWFSIEVLLIFFRMGDFSYITGRLGHFIPESIVLSLFAPLFFGLLNKVWGREKEMIGVDA